MNSSKNKIYNRFAIWLPISLILNGYSSGIPGFSLGSLCFIVFAIDAIRRNSWRMTSIGFSAILVLIVLFVISICDFAFYGIPSPVKFIIPFFKIILWCLFIICVAPTFFNLVVIEKWFTRVGIILTIYLIIQNVAYYGAGVYLPNIFKFGIIQPYADGYADYEALSSGYMIRPASLLSESSYLGNYLMLNLALVLQRLNYLKYKRDMMLCLFLTIGIALSSSTSAIILMVIIWGMLGWNILKDYKIIVISSSVVIGFFLYINPLSLDQFDDNSQVNTAIFQTFDKLNHMEDNTRFGKSYAMIDKLSPMQSFCGVGIGNEQMIVNPFANDKHQYLNSISELIIGVGYLGASFVALFFITSIVDCIKLHNRLGLALLMIYIIKIFGSGFLFNTYGLLYMFVIVGSLVNPVKINSYHGKLHSVHLNHKQESI